MEVGGWRRSLIQPRPRRPPADRPIIKLSVGLTETFSQINQVRSVDEFAHATSVGMIFFHVTGVEVVISLTTRCFRIKAPPSFY